MTQACRPLCLVTSAALASAVCAPAFASPDSPLGFAGGFVQAAGAVVKSKTEIDFTGWFNVKPDDQSTVGELSAGYGWDFNGFSVRALGFYILGNQKAGTTTQNSPFNLNEVNDTVSMTQKNT
jgi:phosphate-selective porin